VRRSRCSDEQMAAILLGRPHVGRGSFQEARGHRSGHLPLTEALRRHGAGTRADAGPFVALTALFPMDSTGDSSVGSLQARINDCFERSMNGRPLAWSSKEMNAMLMSMRGLSTGIPDGIVVAGRGMGAADASLTPDRVGGRQATLPRALAAAVRTAPACRTAVAGTRFRRSGAGSRSTSAPAWRALKQPPLLSWARCRSGRTTR